MTPASLDMAWPTSCSRCSVHRDASKAPQERGYQSAADASPHAFHSGEPREARGAYQAHPQGHFTASALAGVQPAANWARGLGDQLHEWDHMSGQRGTVAAAGSVEEAECLEVPLPLVSDMNYMPPAVGPNWKPDKSVRPCACCPPANAPGPSYGPYPVDPPQGHHWISPHNRLQHPDHSHSVQGFVPQGLAPPREVMHEVSVGPFQAPGAVTGTIRRTISLPDECRNVFITYSLDTARDILNFTKFLVDQGFRPAIDVFHNPLQTMSINKWMDKFLNDKSVLIIVVISPKYKEDVEGNGDDEHGLHTKYIHNQIQNEFIQQGCLNFRLVPVLFPNATKRHVPTWLQSTRIYRWPLDMHDLLLRLFREERYIIPQRGGDLTLTVRPL
ncbi:E3 ubiquitin ligase TRAF3IP2 isoform X2 [Betta splendens]|nr:E3 ubiquitin ligase TRAF3IP2 isoform X2 [Betta splendens]